MVSILEKDHVSSLYEDLVKVHREYVCHANVYVLRHHVDDHVHGNPRF